MNNNNNDYYLCIFLFMYIILGLHSNLIGYAYHLLLFFYVWPANQPIGGVALRHKKFGRPCFKD
jgi:hypothetical protein